MYESIYADPALLEQYARAQEYSMPGKRFVARTVLAELEATPSSICLAPSDIGQYYQVFSELLPGVQFRLIDRAPQAHAWVQRAHVSRDVSFEVLDLSRPLSPMGQSDLVCCMFGAHLLGSGICTIANLARIVAPKGHLALLTMTPDQAASHPMARHRLTAHGEAAFDATTEFESMMQREGLEDCRATPVHWRDSIPVGEIPKAFAKCANSYLYRMTPSELAEVHRALAARASYGVVELDFTWTLFLARNPGR